MKSKRTTDAKWWQKLTLPLARWANNMSKASKSWHMLQSSEINKGLSNMNINQKTNRSENLIYVPVILVHNDSTAMSYRETEGRSWSPCPQNLCLSVPSEHPRLLFCIFNVHFMQLLIININRSTQVINVKFKIPSCSCLVIIKPQDWVAQMSIKLIVN